MANTRKVGILGTGDVGKALAAGFLAVGDEVKIGSREPGKITEWAQKQGARCSAGTFADAASFGEVVVIATLGKAAKSAIKMAGADHFKGKVVIDVTNPLELEGGKPSLYVGHTDSEGEQIQRWLRDAKVVKAFNTVGHAHMFRPTFPGGPPDMFIAGNDASAKKVVGEICKAFGWGVIDLGGIESSRYLEPMCMAWVLHGALSGSWNHAFKMLHN